MKEQDVVSLSNGFVEGDFNYLKVDYVDNLTLARSYNTRSPRQIFSDLQNRGFIGDIHDFIADSKPLDNNTLDWTQWALENLPDWSEEEWQRFVEAKQHMDEPDDTVITTFARLANPHDLRCTREVLFIVAGGVQEGLITARGVYQMRKAIEEAQNRGVPIVHINAVKSADPLFASEVGHMTDEISKTMELGLSLTVPKVTVITGEAASAGAHAGWQIADKTLINEHGAFLTVIDVYEAMKLLHLDGDVLSKVRQKLAEKYSLEDDPNEVFNLLEGLSILERFLEISGSQKQVDINDRIVLEAILTVIKKASSQLSEKVMLIMPADNDKFISGMLTRGADMVTIHADDWQKNAQLNSKLSKQDFFAHLHTVLQEAQVRKTADADIYLRIKSDNFSGFWRPEDITLALIKLYEVGLTGIRLTEKADAEVLASLSTLMADVERKLNIARGTFKICLSVEDNDAIETLVPTVSAGDTDKRVAAVVMGVRDYTHSLGPDGVKDREWDHNAVIVGKTRLSENISALMGQGWPNITFIQAVSAIHNDYDEIHKESVASKNTGADGMLAISADQIPHIRAAYEGIFLPNGTPDRERLAQAYVDGKKIVATAIPNTAVDRVIADYGLMRSQAMHEMGLTVLNAGGAFPIELKRTGIVDKIIYYDTQDEYTEALARSLWTSLETLTALSPQDIYAKRHAKLARLGQDTLKSTHPISVETRHEKALGRESRAAQFWVDLLTSGSGFNEEILETLEPNPTHDMIAKIGKRGRATYASQIKEAQDKTGTLSGIIAGYIDVNGKNILLIVRDQDYINATAGAATGEFVRRACLNAVEKNHQQEVAGIVYIDVSAGGRVQEGAMALTPSELALAGLVEAKRNGIPLVNIGHSYVLGSDAIGPFNCADTIALVGKNTELGLAGRRIVESTSPRGKKEFPAQFRLGTYHLALNHINALLNSPNEVPNYLRLLFK